MRRVIPRPQPITHSTDRRVAIRATRILRKLLQRLRKPASTTRTLATAHFGETQREMSRWSWGCRRFPAKRHPPFSSLIGPGRSKVFRRVRVRFRARDLRCLLQEMRSVDVHARTTVFALHSACPARRVHRNRDELSSRAGAVGEQRRRVADGRRRRRARGSRGRRFRRTGTGRGDGRTGASLIRSSGRSVRARGSQRASSSTLVC
jgi:hypothetical protein